MILTEPEIQELTKGLVRPTAQARELANLGIPFKRRRDGSLVVHEAFRHGAVPTRGLARPVETCPIQAASNVRLRRAARRLSVLHLDQLRGLPLVDRHSRCGIYFLWLGPRLRYIGQSVEVFRRVGKHAESKQFDRATWLRVPDEALDRYERAYVWHYSPPLNMTRHG